jgi:hypothetical protein
MAGHSSSIAQSFNEDYIYISRQDHEAEHCFHLRARSRMGGVLSLYSIRHLWLGA